MNTETFVAVANVVFYDYKMEKKKEGIFLTEIKNFTDAMTKIEEYYGEDLDSVTLTLCEGPFMITHESYTKKYIEGMLDDVDKEM